MLEDLVERAGGKTVTLLLAARDALHHNAVVLADLLRHRLGSDPAGAEWVSGR